MVQNHWCGIHYINYKQLGSLVPSTILKLFPITLTNCIVDVILIVLESQKAEIQFVLEKTDLEIKIEYVAISEDEDIGTADSLRLISDRLKSDVVVLSSDMVSDVDLGGVLNLFRMHNATLATLLFHPQPSENVILPGPKSKNKPGGFNCN